MVSSQRRSKAGPRSERSLASVSGEAIPAIGGAGTGGNRHASASPRIWPISSTWSRSMRRAIASSPGEAPRPGTIAVSTSACSWCGINPDRNAASTAAPGAGVGACDGLGGVTGAFAHPARTTAARTTTATTRSTFTTRHAPIVADPT